MSWTRLVITAFILALGPAVGSLTPSSRAADALPACDPLRLGSLDCSEAARRAWTRDALSSNPHLRLDAQAHLFACRVKSLPRETQVTQIDTSIARGVARILARMALDFSRLSDPTPSPAQLTDNRTRTYQCWRAELAELPSGDIMTHNLFSNLSDHLPARATPIPDDCEPRDQCLANAVAKDYNWALTVGAFCDLRRATEIVLPGSALGFPTELFPCYSR